MTELSDHTIRQKGIFPGLCERREIVRHGIRTSYGLGPASYDLQLHTIQDEFGNEVDEYTFRPGNNFVVLGVAKEEFIMPNDVKGIVHDKSTWARLGLFVQNTLIDPGWRGFLTLEFTYHGRKPLTVCEGMGICQVAFTQLYRAAT